MADGRHIDLANFNAHVLSFWKHEKDKAPYSEALKTEVETAKLAGRVWERRYWDICAERGCKHADTGAYSQLQTARLTFAGEYGKIPSSNQGIFR